MYVCTIAEHFLAQYYDIINCLSVIAIFLFMPAITTYEAAFGRGTSPVVLYNVTCTGTEFSLLSCSLSELPRYYLGYIYFFYFFCDSDAGVACPSCKSCFDKKILFNSELLSQLNNSWCQQLWILYTMIIQEYDYIASVGMQTN